MSMSLAATIDQAEVTFENGDYRSVVDSCTHILDQYPHYTPAQQLLGKAYLEQGQVGDAELWFGRLLALDPRNPAGYLGLGLIAEDRAVLDHALAYCQVAWELAPYNAQFREPVNRVAQKRYGNDGRLRLTQAALAQIHANASRSRRAIRAYQSALISLPERIDLWMGLATTLWMLGEYADASEIAREFLKDHTKLIPALVILTDIENRAGDTSQAAEYRDRLRLLDPDSGVTAAMVARQPLADTSYLLVAPEDHPHVAERTDTVVSERLQFAPAPDFTFQPERDDEAIIMDIDDLQPIRLEEFADDELVEPAETTYDAIDNLEPLNDTEPDPVAAGIGGIQLFDMELDDDPQPFSIGAVSEAEIEHMLGDFEGLVPMSLDDFGALENNESTETSGYFEDSEIDFDFKIEDPDAVRIGGSPSVATPEAAGSSGAPLNSAPPDAGEPELAADQNEPSYTATQSDSEPLEPTDPARDVEDDGGVAGTAPEPTTAEAPTAILPGTGFTRLLSELGDEGLMPFNPAQPVSDEPPATAAAGEDASKAFPSLADGWDDIDAQLASATPADDSNDELLDFDDLGLKPFVLDDEEIDQVTSVDPVRRPEQPVSTEVEASEPEPASAQHEIAEPALVPSEADDKTGMQAGFEFDTLPWDRPDGATGIDVQEVLAEVRSSGQPLGNPARSTSAQTQSNAARISHNGLAHSKNEPARERERVEDEPMDQWQLDQIDSHPNFANSATQLINRDQPHTNVMTPSVEDLVMSAAIFERSHAGKAELVHEGTIAGDHDLPAARATTPQIQAPSPPETVKPEMESGGLGSPSKPVEIDELQAAVEDNPEDPEMRWLYAEALRADKDYHAAFATYRWLIRQAPERHDTIITALELCAQDDHAADVAHRLLSDLYHRRGDAAQARNHAAIALATRRLMREAAST